MLTPEEEKKFQQKLIKMGGIVRQLPPTDKETLKVLIAYSKNYLDALEAGDKWCKETKERWGLRLAA